MQPTAGGRVEQVVADQLSTRAQYPAGFGEYLFPREGMVQHKQTEHSIKRLVREGECARIGRLDSDLFVIGSKSRAGRVDHRGIVVCDRHVGVRPSLHEGVSHRAAAASDLQHLAGKLLPL